MLRITLPLVLPGVLGAAIFVFAEMLGSFSAALVLGLPSRFYVVTTAMYQLVSQYPPQFPPRGRDGRLALRGDVRHGVRLPARRPRGQLRHHHRQGLPGRARWTWPACAGRCSGLLRRLPGARGGAAGGHPALRVVPAARHRVPARRTTSPSPTTGPRSRSTRCGPRCRQQPAPGPRHRHHRRGADGLARVDDLPLAAAGGGRASSTC